MKFFLKDPRAGTPYLLPCAPPAGDAVDPGFLPSRLAKCDSRASRRLLGALGRERNERVNYSEVMLRRRFFSFAHPGQIWNVLLIDAELLGSLEELANAVHPDEEPLVDVQRLPRVLFVHVKILLCNENAY